jgi:tetratricopeptide (TPR) repeat protein
MELFEESIAVSREFGHRRAMALHIAGLSLAVNALGEHERARQLADESLLTARKIGDKLAIVTALGGLGDALRAEGDYRRARACFLEGFRLAAERGLRSMLLFLLIGWASLLAQEGEREQAVEILALVHHNSVGLEAFGEVAKSRLAELAPELPSEVLVAAEESGKAKELEEVVEGIVGR